MIGGDLMNFRKLGKTGIKVSEIGLGTEYLINASAETIKQVVQYALNKGINYFDLLQYLENDIENFGVAFQGSRDKAILAGHLGIAQTDGQYRKTRSVDESNKLFEQMLLKLGTDYIDILHLHNVDSEDFNQVMDDSGLLGLAFKLKREGKVRFIGFSGHDTDIAVKAVKSGNIDVIMHPINFLWEPVKRFELMKTCMSEGVGLIAMKPFAGGEVFLRKDFDEITPVKCLSYILSQIAVSTVVPGCKNVKELEESLQYIKSTLEERDFIDIIRNAKEEFKGICVHCNHCLPCPSKIDIGEVIRILSLAESGVAQNLGSIYHTMQANASDCVECGACESRCPFGVKVMSKMKQMVNLF